MNEQLVVEKAVESISGEKRISVFLTDPPQAVVMPFAKDHGKKYLTAVVFLIEQALNLETLAFICSVVIEVVSIDSSHELDGVEVLACVMREGRSQRVLRLSVLSKSLRRASNLSAEELRSTEPFDGVTCHIYLKDLVTSA